MILEPNQEKEIIEALTECDIKTISKFFKKGFNVNYTFSKYERKPLHYAASGIRHPEVTKRFLDFLFTQEDIEIDAKDIFGDTPLISAANKENRQAILMLLERGADYTIKDRDGKSITRLISNSSLRAEVESIIRKLDQEKQRVITLKDKQVTPQKEIFYRATIANSAFLQVESLTDPVSIDKLKTSHSNIKTWYRGFLNALGLKNDTSKENNSDTDKDKSFLYKKLS